MDTLSKSKNAIWFSDFKMQLIDFLNSQIQGERIDFETKKFDNWNFVLEMQNEDLIKIDKSEEWADLEGIISFIKEYLQIENFYTQDKKRYSEKEDIDVYINWDWTIRINRKRDKIWGTIQGVGDIAWKLVGQMPK